MLTNDAMHRPRRLTKSVVRPQKLATQGSKKYAEGLVPGWDKLRYVVLEGFGCDSVYPPGSWASRHFRCLYNRTMTKYVSMMFSKLCRDDAAIRQRMEPTKTKRLVIFLMLRDSMGGRVLLCTSIMLLYWNVCT